MDQDRRDAAAWAKEWQIRRKNRRLLTVVGVIVGLALLGYLMQFAIVHTHRSTFGSVEEMRAAMQGRFARDNDYTDIMIEGDDITKTYLAYSHYNKDYAERYGYDADTDSVYEDHITEWDYRHGVIRTEWMGDWIVDKNGNIQREGESYYTYYKTNDPRPEPIDPSTLNNVNGSENATIPDDELEGIEERQESMESTEDAAEDAGVEEGGGTIDDGNVQA
ncbi:MAG: hypothetical protein IJ227_02305 [Mogibacterium sp.]|nr:hypothetical protein [Mogibacterium sp.]